ncbi:MAG: Dabb family protein [Candidatus Hydrogenedentes bacterium]|nr:Dabb family protein [Candidatus Hydrogenedentota bacterium]
MLAEPLTREAPFVHVVLFKLPAQARPGERDQLLRDIQGQLAPLPTVKSLWCGTPADTKTPGRFMVDTDYDVGLLVLFANREDLEAYLAHPVHAKFAGHYDSYCTLRVFDFVM